MTARLCEGCGMLRDHCRGHADCTIEQFRERIAELESARDIQVVNALQQEVKEARTRIAELETMIDKSAQEVVRRGDTIAELRACLRIAMEWVAGSCVDEEDNAEWLRCRAALKEP